MWNYLKKTEKPIVIYGMGNGADKIINILEKLNIPISGIFASDDFVRYQQFRGFTVEKFSELENRLGEMIVLVAFGTQRDDVLENIYRIQNRQELYAPDVPVYGDGLFTADYAKQHSAELEKVYSLLSDDLSKSVFENTVRYRITGDISFLKKIETTPSEAYENILKLSKNETYLDLGAYNGDTVEEFLAHTDGYNKIYALEPDKKNFKKLKLNTAELENIELINKAVYDKSGEINFSSLGGRNSTAMKNGEKIDAVSVDDILNGQTATYIKFDVEGYEQKAILGAEKTIKAHKPKMLISAYHRTEDYFSLPLEIHKMRDDYKIYMRHYKYIPAWDTQFYFV